MRIIKAPVPKEHAILRKGLRLVFQVATENEMSPNRKVGCTRIIREKNRIDGNRADFTRR
jgi:hypothetical protein